MTETAPAESAGQTNVPEYSVSELSGALKRTIEEAYGFVRVRGELGRTLIARSGHLYADLKDDKAVINGVMWKGGVAKLNFKPEEGLEVVVEGRLSTYPGRSQYQLIIERMAPAGVGALMALLEERKKKLATEGLFAEDKKRALPFLPEVVGVVTSPTGAVIRDILHRIADRFPRRVLVWPVLVQGEQAAGQVAQAIKGFNALSKDGPVPRPDVLIVARGGGSIEDLWAFNEEIVVRAAADSDIPLISAVGHETDWTLIDLASDRRAPTPTGAAEMAVPVRADLASRLDTIRARTSAIMARALERRGADLKAAGRGLRRPEDILGPKTQRLDAARLGLRTGLKSLADRASIQLSRVAGRLRPEALARDIGVKRERVGELAGRAGAAQPRILDRRRRDLASFASRLESVNPKAVLERGYALVRRPDGSLARRAGDLGAGDQVSLEFADGAKDAVVGEGGSKPGKSERAGAPEGRKSKSGARSAGGSSTDQGALF
ncbi:MAG: exodeoxyribonuclease VII large subunit [Maricaulaceae bacterium]|jgi:exodeoxyribonuclease VII large subunit